MLVLILIDGKALFSVANSVDTDKLYVTDVSSGKNVTSIDQNRSTLVALPNIIW